MSNPMVRRLGSVTDLHGMAVAVGVDHDCVTVRGDGMFNAAQQEEFAQLYVAACSEAAVNAERMRMDAALDTTLDVTGVVLDPRKDRANRQEIT